MQRPICVGPALVLEVGELLQHSGQARERTGSPHCSPKGSFSVQLLGAKANVAFAFSEHFKMPSSGCGRQLNPIGQHEPGSGTVSPHF